MASINVSSITSDAYGSFDWQSMVDKLISVDSQPITTLQTEETANTAKIESITQIETDLEALQTTAQALSESSLFTSRTASASGSGWTPTAATGATIGTYSVAVTQLATAAKRIGASDIGSSLSDSNDVSSLTLGSLATATTLTAGTFSVDGAQITVALTDSLQDVFDKIYSATSGVVTASYSSSTDKITLTSSDSSEIVLGTSADTSNFLAAMHLANNSASSVSSSTSLGAVSLTATLSSARLRSSITAVDSSGNGSFTINGTSISYNVNSDTLKTVISRINAAGAGVTASYDATNDRMVLTSTSTGDIGIGATETSGGLLDALGLTSNSTLQHGQNALFSVNGGDTVTSMSNTLSSDDLGVTGLTLAVTSVDTQTVTVAADATSMQTAIQEYIDAYNTVQTYLEEQTKTSIGSDGSVTTSTLSSNLEVQNIGSSLRSRTFAAVSDVTGTIDRLSDLGIDFDLSGTLSISDSTTLTAALTNSSDSVAEFFGTATTGFGPKINSYLTSLLSSSGSLAKMSSTLTSQNKDIESQIATLKELLATEREQLTTAFEAMQEAQNTAQTQSSYLTKLYKSSS